MPRPAKPAGKRTAANRLPGTRRLIVEHEGQAQVIVNGKNRVRSYELENGRVALGVRRHDAQRHSLAGGRRRRGLLHRAAIAARRRLPFRSSARGDMTDSAKVLWRYGKGTPYVPSPLLLGDRLIFTQANTADT